MYLNQNILKAQVYALKQHHDQEYGEGIPYSVHLMFVNNIIHHFIHLVSEKDRETVIISGWLHDVREDRGKSYNEIKSLYGYAVAEVVYCVTNEDGRTRIEKAEKTYPKVAQNRLAVFVKLADRIANTVYSKMSGSGMFEKYCKEYAHFKQVLYQPGEFEEMWQYLDDVVSSSGKPIPEGYSVSL